MASQQALVDAVSTLLVSEYSAFASFALVVYDWIINLDEEIDCFWDFHKGRKLTAAALIYGMTRYPLIVATLLVLQTAFPMSETACRVNYHIQSVATFLWSFAPAVFSAVRIYALAPNHKAVAIATFLLFMPGLAILGWHMVVRNESFTLVKLNINVRTVTLAGLTIVALAHNFGDTGSTYFMYISPYHCAVIMPCSNDNLVPGSVQPALENVAGIVINPITAVLISHFLFDLRRSDHTANIPSSPSAIPSLNIAGGVQEDHGTLPAFIASMGSRIDAGLHFVDSPDADEDMAPWHTTNEGASPEEGSPPGDEMR
ncbi:hypothetical protein LXA43DRAFT_1067811 [Ganoderma leucocontextum]|nr:hypothetical protein LXA43DRAFT_1067811 [Ganoderma leucocontextum]